MTRIDWMSGSGRIDLALTLDEAASASHQGQCDEDVDALSRLPHIASQLAAIDPSVLAAELSEYGAWDETELADHEQNLQRVLWIASGDIIERDGEDDV